MMSASQVSRGVEEESRGGKLIMPLLIACLSILFIGLVIYQFRHEGSGEKGGLASEQASRGLAADSPPPASSRATDPPASTSGGTPSVAGDPVALEESRRNLGAAS